MGKMGGVWIAKLMLTLWTDSPSQKQKLDSMAKAHDPYVLIIFITSVRNMSCHVYYIYDIVIKHMPQKVDLCILRILKPKIKCMINDFLRQHWNILNFFPLVHSPSSLTLYKILDILVILPSPHIATIQCTAEQSFQPGVVLLSENYLTSSKLPYVPQLFRAIQYYVNYTVRRGTTSYEVNCYIYGCYHWIHDEIISHFFKDKARILTILEAV